MNNNPNLQLSCSRAYYEFKKVINNCHDYHDQERWLDTILDFGCLPKKELDILASQFQFKYDKEFGGYLPLEEYKAPLPEYI